MSGFFVDLRYFVLTMWCRVKSTSQERPDVWSSFTNSILGSKIYRRSSKFCFGCFTPFKTNYNRMYPYLYAPITTCNQGIHRHVPNLARYSNNVTRLSNIMSSCDLYSMNTDATQGHL